MDFGLLTLKRFLVRQIEVSEFSKLSYRLMYMSKYMPDNLEDTNEMINQLEYLKKLPIVVPDVKTIWIDNYIRKLQEQVLEMEIFLNE